MKKRFQWIAASLLGCSLLSFANAESDPPEKIKVPPRRIRFLALGDAPPFEQEVRDGVRYELEPPPGSVPPREVIPVFGEKEKDQKQPDPVRLNLGRITPATTIPDGAGAIELRKKGIAGSSLTWLTLQRPEHGDLMVLMWRDPKGKSWDQVSAMVIPDGAASPGPGGVQLLNLTTATVGVTLGLEKIALPSGKLVVKKPEGEKEAPLEVGALGADLKLTGKRFLATVLPVNASECSRVIIYRADGEEPRQPVKVLVLREPAVPLAPTPAPALPKH